MPLSTYASLPNTNRSPELPTIASIEDAAPALFDRHTRLTARMLGVPIALITLIDSDWHYIKGSFGLPESWKSTSRLPLRGTCCDMVVAAGQPVLVSDISSQPAFAEHIDPHKIGIVAYAGVPLQNENGQILGTVCAIDTAPHNWSSIDRENLEDLASAVMAQIMPYTTAVDRSRAEQFEIGKRRCLEALATGQPLKAVLSVLAEGIESQLQQTHCAVMLLDQSAQYLMTAAAPSLPDTYTTLIDGIAIGPTSGSCGAAAYTGTIVVSSDLASDPHWTPWRELALSYNLRACLSVPFFSSTGSVLGTFAVYYTTAHTPAPRDLQQISEAAHIAAVAIERWQTLDALRVSEANLAAVFEHASDSIFSIDQFKRLKMSNPVFAQQRQLSNMETTSEFRVNGMFTTNDLSFWSHQYDRALAGEQFHFEYQRVVGGVEGWFDISLNPIRVNGVVTGVSIISRDITQRILQEQQRLEVERTLQETQRLESLGVLAGGIAHDFNNLLAAIQGHTGLALLDLPAHSHIRENLIQIDQAVDQAALLTRQLLAYAGKGRLSTQLINMSDLISEMRRLITKTLTPSITVLYQLTPDLLLLEGDRTHLQQVVLNLTANAVEAIDKETGMVTITTRLLEVGQDQIAGAHFAPVLTTGAYIILEVRDSGCGMDESTRTHMFEPFFTTKFAGRGLGLSAVQGIVRGHHGSLHVQSMLGQGTIFQIAFPCTSTVAIPSRSAFSHPAIKTAPMLGPILVIDDEPGVQQIAVRLLERLGHSAIAAADGRQALDMLRNKPDQVGWILLDWTMPGLSGPEMISALRAIRADIPIVVMSGYGAQEIDLSLDTLGLNGFIQKPFRLNDLRAIISRIVGTSKTL